MQNTVLLGKMLWLKGVQVLEGPSNQASFIDSYLYSNKKQEST